MLLIIALGGMAIGGLLPFVSASMTGAAREELNTRAYYAADAAVQRVIAYAVATSPSEPHPEWPDHPPLEYDGESYQATVSELSGSIAIPKKWLILPEVSERPRLWGFRYSSVPGRRHTRLQNQALSQSTLSPNGYSSCLHGGRGLLVNLAIIMASTRTESIMLVHLGR